MNFSYGLFFLVVVFFVSGDALMDPCGSKRQASMNKTGVAQQDLTKAVQTCRTTSLSIDITTVLDVKVVAYFVDLITGLGCINEEGVLDHLLFVEVLQHVFPRTLSIEIFTSVWTSIYAGKALVGGQIVTSLLKFIHYIIQLTPKVIFDLTGLCQPPVMPSNMPLLSCTVNLPTSGILPLL